MDAGTFHWIVIAVIGIGFGSIYDRLGSLHDKAMNARLEHDRRLLERLEAIERRLQAVSLDLHTLPTRMTQMDDGRPIGEVLGDALNKSD